MPTMNPRQSGLACLIIALCIGAGALAAPPTATLEGRVLQRRGAAPIAGAQVKLLPAGPSTTTNARGEFRLAKLTPRTWTVQVKAAGFATARRRVRLVGGGQVSLTVRMRPLSPPPRMKAAEKTTSADKRRVHLRRKRHRPATVSMGLGGIGYGGGSGRGMAASAPLRMAGRAMLALAPAPAEGPADREGYDPIDENAFRAVRDAPLSTFSIDVDTAAYANVRRFIRTGRLPPKGAVRIEELINYFPYTYAGPRDGRPFSVHTQASIAPWNPAHRLVRVAVQGRRIDVSKLPPSNLVFLLDVSGSMHSPDKLPLLKRSLSLLVQALRPQDSVAIVVYAGAAGLVLPPTSGADKGAILGALDGLQAGGSTAGGAGIRLAYEVAAKGLRRGGNNRVILATDGDFNVGQSSDDELVRMIERRRKSGIYLTVLGFGTGNYQDAKMQKLADKGNGNHAYIDSLMEAKKVLVSEMGGTLLTIAKDVKIQVEFNPTRVKGYRLIGYENRMLKARDFNDDKKDAGELGAGHAVTALYELIPAGSAEPLAGADRLKYQAISTTAAAHASDELMTVKLRYKTPTSKKSELIVRPVRDRHLDLSQTGDDFRFATAVAELGLLLRDSPLKARASWRALIDRARGALGRDDGGHRQAFVKLAERAAALSRSAVR